MILSFKKMSNAMNQDSVFYFERNLFKKTALLLTIPCAIQPILLAVIGMMSLSTTPLLFQYDYLIFGCIYSVYFYGLYLSWQVHFKILPFGLFGIHLISIFLFNTNNEPEWLGYLSIISIMATSISNQYFRLGTIACNDDCKI